LVILFVDHVVECNGIEYDGTYDLLLELLSE
jgi:hypothetical protein